jgi:flavin-dependent dehydrogenase
MDYRVDAVVIGAGVVGLAIARALALAGREVLVLERGNGIGQETSSRNFSERYSQRKLSTSRRLLAIPAAHHRFNLIDFERLSLRPPEISHDLPGGGRRLVQRAEGYVATVVGGRVVYREGAHTGELPGRLVRA